MAIANARFFERHAEKVIDNGFGSVVAVRPETKRPRLPKWQAACFMATDPKWLVRHVQKFPDDSVGIACGNRVVGIDIDATDTELASTLQQIAFEEFGETPLVRVGRWPKRLLVYRVWEEPVEGSEGSEGAQGAQIFATQRVGSIEILGHGAQFVAFGIHPVTGRRYEWINRDDPANTRVTSLPLISAADIKRFLNRACKAVGVVARVMPDLTAANDNHIAAPIPSFSLHISKTEHGTLRSQIIHDTSGRVIDGREAFLTLLIHDHNKRGVRTPEALAQYAWQEFIKSADISRPKGASPRRLWSYKDALRKARAIYRKAAKGRLKITSSGREPVSHLHSHRRNGYWTPGRKKQHQAEATLRTTASSSLIVNEAMLDATPIEAGQCVATAKALKAQTGLGLSTVKGARRDLLDCGLWIAERGVYVPVAIAEDGTGQATVPTRQNAGGVQTDGDALYRKYRAAYGNTVPTKNGEPISAERAQANDNDDPDAEARTA